MKTGQAVVLTFLTSICLNGCGCSETDLGGDTAADSDVPLGDPVWDPPIEGLGTPGWRESTDPYIRCDGWMLRSWDVWSDTRGVFAILTAANPGPTSWPTDDPSDSPTHQLLAFNDGTGWRFLFEVYSGYEMCGEQLTGIPDGQLILYSQDTYDCTWEEGTEAGISLELFDSLALHVVDETLAYALRTGGLLVYWDGTSWGPYPPDPITYDVYVLWADHTSVWVAGNDGIILSEEDGGWRVHDTRTLDSIRTLWGFTEDDVWAGTNTGDLLHWNGEVWENVEWPDAGESTEPHTCDRRGESIQGMWGVDGVLFFHTSTQIAMWDGADFRVLAHWPGEDVWRGEDWHACENRMIVRAMWGNSPEEVFFSMAVSDLYEGPCGEEFLLWWDGSEFHWF